MDETVGKEESDDSDPNPTSRHARPLSSFEQPREQSPPFPASNSSWVPLNGQSGHSGGRLSSYGQSLQRNDEFEHAGPSREVPYQNHGPTFEAPHLAQAASNRQSSQTRGRSSSCRQTWQQNDEFEQAGPSREVPIHNQRPAFPAPHPARAASNGQLGQNGAQSWFKSLSVVKKEEFDQEAEASSTEKYVNEVDNEHEEIKGEFKVGEEQNPDHASCDQYVQPMSVKKEEEMLGAGATEEGGVPDGRSSVEERQGKASLSSKFLNKMNEEDSSSDSGSSYTSGSSYSDDDDLVPEPSAKVRRLEDVRDSMTENEEHRVNIMPEDSASNHGSAGVEDLRSRFVDVFRSICDLGVEALQFKIRYIEEECRPRLLALEVATSQAAVEDAALTIQRCALLGELRVDVGTVLCDHRHVEKNGLRDKLTSMKDKIDEAKNMLTFLTGLPTVVKEEPGWAGEDVMNQDDESYDSGLFESAQHDSPDFNFDGVPEAGSSP